MQVANIRTQNGLDFPETLLTTTYFNFLNKHNLLGQLKSGKGTLEVQSQHGTVLDR